MWVDDGMIVGGRLGFGGAVECSKDAAQFCCFRIRDGSGQNKRQTFNIKLTGASTLTLSNVGIYSWGNGQQEGAAVVVQTIAYGWRKIIDIFAMTCNG